MNPFIYTRSRDAADAVESVSRDRSALFLAGGTTLVDLMRISVMQPTRVVDLSRLPLNQIEEIDGTLRIGALASMATVAEHPVVVRDFPMVSQSLLLAASPQIRNAATIGGNLLQRTRCMYFRTPSLACNKRDPGSGCSALGGQDRTHAVLGVSRKCTAAYPGDLAVALTAIDAELRTRKPDGSERSIPIRSFYVGYGEDPAREHTLEHGEMITSVVLGRAHTWHRSVYIKVRDRESFEFALASCAAGVELEGSTIRDVCVALGGVGTKPWRSVEAEGALRGRRVDIETFKAAAEAALASARPQTHNAFKIPLAKRLIVRALEQLTKDRAL